MRKLKEVLEQASAGARPMGFLPSYTYVYAPGRGSCMPRMNPAASCGALFKRCSCLP